MTHPYTVLFNCCFLRFFSPSPSSPPLISLVSPLALILRFFSFLFPFHLPYLSLSLVAFLSIPSLSLFPLFFRASLFPPQPSWDRRVTLSLPWCPAAGVVRSVLLFLTSATQEHVNWTKRRKKKSKEKISKLKQNVNKRELTKIQKTKKIHE